MKIIYNNLGVAIDGDYANEVVNQGSHNVNIIDFAVDDPDFQANYEDYLATTSITYSNGARLDGLAMSLMPFDYNGKRYYGYRLILSANLTVISGVTSFTFRLQTNGENPQLVLAAQPMIKDIIATDGNNPVIRLSELQYNHLLSELEGKIPLEQKGIPEGVSTLDENGKIPLDQIPSLVDSVLLINEKVIYPSYEDLPFDRMNHKYAYLYLSSKTVGRPPRTQYRLSYVKSEDGEWKKNEGGSIFYKLIVCNEVESTTEPRYRIFKTNIDYSFAPSVDWDRWVKDVGVRVGNNKGDAFDTCRGQKVEQMIDQNYMEGVAVSEYDYDEAMLTIMGNGDFIDRLDETDLHELGEIEIFAKATDHENATNKEAK